MLQGLAPSVHLSINFLSFQLSFKLDQAETWFIVSGVVHIVLRFSPPNINRVKPI